TDAEVLADPRQIKSVLRNLLSNAIKFTRVSGRISFSARLDTDKWTLAVTDDGVGMDSAKSHSLFHTDPDSTLGTKGERGLGLGLQLCMEFVHANGGTITVESTPEKGTTFLVTLPAAAVASKAPIA
ncbi:MAG: ATP-binding protein, partial [Cupriavidus sp.]